MPPTDSDDLPLDHSRPAAFGDPGPSRPGGSGSRPTAVIVALLLLILLGVGGWWMWKRRQAQAAVPAPVAATSTPAAAPAPSAPELPAIDLMDPMLRALIGALSTRPELVRWLATDDLIRQLALAIDMASQGKSPSREFRTFAPTRPFTAARRGAGRVIDTASYRRYNSLVQLVTSLDASAVVRIYRTIQPRLNEAYRARGYPNGDVNHAAQVGLGILLETPVVRGPVALVESTGNRWAFADPALEARPGSQKQLLRMGPDNVDPLLVWLRSLQGQLGPS